MLTSERSAIHWDQQIEQRLIDPGSAFAQNSPEGHLKRKVFRMKILSGSKFVGGNLASVQQSLQHFMAGGRFVGWTHLV